MLDVAVIGAGVVGLACAAALARRKSRVIVIERNARAGQEISARNSGVIHAGIYYPADSLKAKLCVEGRERLYERCHERDIPHRRTGKLIVATDNAQVSILENLRQRGSANGAGELRIVDHAEVKRIEPKLRAVAALHSPETGIVDAHALVSSLQVELEQCGGSIVLATTVMALERRGDIWRVDTENAEGERYTLEVPFVVNAAGLSATELSARAGGATYEMYPCKGDYFALAASFGMPAQHLVYPVPGVAGLGIHLTFDLAGACRLGPDTEYVDSPHYDVDPTKAEKFADAVRSFLPTVQQAQLHPDYAGIRPKLQAPGADFHDFVIDESLSGLIGLLGIESPGLTAALALGEQVAARIEKKV